MAGQRYRLVTTQGLEHHISSVVLSKDEADQHLMVEASMHRGAGWNVHLSGRMMVAHRMGESGVLTRTICIEEFSPMEDIGA